ncbi:hypothetical protein LCGC14_2502150 [marine sediment metagenome]|uniref:Uncharacterized protein n=1 Tax=marine sediment metagenome TaxID=412755 RepID=A0A0F9BPL0_9ZZZZ
MKIKGVSEIIKDLTEMQENVSEKIDNVDWEKNEDRAEEIDNRLNDVYMNIDQAMDLIKEIKEI